MMAWVVPFLGGPEFYHFEPDQTSDFYKLGGGGEAVGGLLGLAVGQCQRHGKIARQNEQLLGGRRWNISTRNATTYAFNFSQIQFLHDGSNQR
jgi:hypothetical protein